jgi:TRAP-type uncharacterized transport system substrate-binding protein
LWQLAATLLLGLSVNGLGPGNAIAQSVESWRIPSAELPRIELTEQERERTKNNLVSIVTGAPDGAYAPLGYDLMRLLNDRAQQTLRVAAILGEGSINNLADLRYLPRVDFAIVQSDVLEAYERTPAGRELRNSLRYVSRLHTELLHIISRRDIVGDSPASVCSLANRRVNVAGSRSGTALTVRTALNGILGLNISLDPSNSTKEGFEQLYAGQVDAVAFVVGKPAPAFQQVDRRKFIESGLTFVSLPFSLLQDGCARKPAPDIAERSPYEPAQILESDYRGLLTPDRPVETIGVPAVLAAFSWPSGTPRSLAASEFIKRLLQIAPDAQNGFGRPNGGFSPQWCGIDLSKRVKNWTRHEAADIALRDKAATSFVIRCGLARVPSCNDSKLLQTEFSAWYAREFPNQNASGAAYLSAYESFRRDRCG